jgi:hypothetical protein
MAPGDPHELDSSLAPIGKRGPRARPDVFFLERGDSMDAARAVCNHCPVSTECLAFALAQPELKGVWGGESSRGDGG